MSKRVKTFIQAWAEKKAAGYEYGRDALESVKLGWDMACADRDEQIRVLEAQLQLERTAAENEGRMLAEDHMTVERDLAAFREALAPAITHRKKAETDGGASISYHHCAVQYLDAALAVLAAVANKETSGPPAPDPLAEVRKVVAEMRRAAAQDGCGPWRIPTWADRLDAAIGKCGKS